MKTVSRFCRLVALLLPVVFGMLLSGGCQQEVPKVPVAVIDTGAVDGEVALENARQLLEFTPRDAGTPGAQKAAEFLQQAVAPYVDRCRIDEFEDDTPRGRLTFRNVIGVLKGGTDGIVILASHYDTKSGIADFQGANDSGSSSGLLLELSRVLNSSPRLPFTVIFLFLDGEECMDGYSRHDGLHGSRRMAKVLRQQGHLRNVKAMILLDMVGDRDLTLTLPRNVDPRLRKMAFAAARDAGIRKKIGLAEMAILDDHVPFIEAGIPAIDLIDFHYGSAPGLNDYWHTAADSLEHISASSLRDSGAIAVGIINRLAAASRGNDGNE